MAKNESITDIEEKVNIFTKVMHIYTCMYIRYVMCCVLGVAIQETQLRLKLEHSAKLLHDAENEVC